MRLAQRSSLPGPGSLVETQRPFKRRCPVASARRTSAAQRRVRCWRHAVAPRPSRSPCSRRVRHALADARDRRRATHRRCASPRDFGAHPRCRGSSGGTSPAALDGGGARLGLPDHLLSRRRPARRRRRAAASRRASCCSRMPRSPISSAAACATTSASRAAASASPQAARRRHRRVAARLAARARAAGGGASRYARAPRATAPASPSTSQLDADAAGAAARRRRRLAQGPAARADEPLLQRAAARGARHARARRPSRSPSPAAPGSTTNGAMRYLDRERRRLGLDRHEPRRRQRADGVPPAPRRRQQRSGPAAAFAAPAARRATSPPARSRSRRAGVWSSPASRHRYPVAMAVATPAGRFDVRALLDDQELDSRGSTGAIYWEGLSTCSTTQRRARRPRLPRDDRLRRRALRRCRSAPLSARRRRRRAAFFAGLREPDTTISTKNSTADR